MASFRVLGPVEAWTDERRITLGGPQQVKLLAFLLLSANRALSADAVIDAVWGSERDGAAKRLQMGVLRLRRALAPLDGEDGSRLRTVGSGYLLRIGPGELDAEVFSEQVREGRRALDDGDPARAIELLAQALELWRGPPLAEVAFDDFAQAEIRRLDELHLVALETRIDADLQQGHHTELIAELEGLLARQPARERLAGQLMTALYRAGRQADALDAYQRTRTHLAEQLGLEPGPALKALQAEILEQAPALAVAGEPAPSVFSCRGMPWSATPMIGRERELEDCRALLLVPDARLVTVTGPGGVGKTRLAFAVARQVEGDFADGIRLAELAGVGRAQDVGVTLVRALDAAPVQGESAAQTLSRYLADKHLLFVVDNFEHVLDAAGLVGELIASCPGLTVLVTSREALNLAAEHQYRVAPMPLPARPSHATLAEVEATAGTALFLAVARRHEHSFTIREPTAPVVAQLCTRLDGLPLALELAAARIRVLSLEELTARVNDALGVLGSGPRDAPERQQTLQATINWSYRLLTAEEQQAFIRFSVFAGGATLTAAQAITGASLKTLEALHAKNLLSRQKQQQPDGTTRLVMLETLRQFALEESSRRGDVEQVRGQHFDYYLRVVEHWVGSLATADEPQALDTLDRDIDNIRSALTWALTAHPVQAIKLAGLLGEYWRIHLDPQGLVWLDAALAAAGDKAPAPDRARVQFERGFQLSLRSEPHAAIDAAMAALELYQETSDDAGIATAYGGLATERLRLGQYTEARANAEAACAHAQAAGDDALLGRAFSILAMVLPPNERFTVFERAAGLLSQAGDDRTLAHLYTNASWVALSEDRPKEAIDLLKIALPAAEKLHAPAAKTAVLDNTGLAQLLLGNPKRARAAFVEALRLCTSDAFRLVGAETLTGLAAVLIVEGELERGTQLLAAAKAAGYPGQDPYNQAMLDRLERDYFDAARARLGPAVWNQLTRAGAKFSFDQAVAFALAESGDTGHSVSVIAET